jgi:hypothetical protein
MNPNIKEILAKIDKLSEALRVEQSRLAEKYGFSFKKQKIVFLQKFRERNKSFKFPAWKYLLPQNIRHLLSMPFIYSMILPAVILDFFITIYQAFAFSLYGIPKVNRREYIVYDRHFLDYLNWVQKINCVYCTYVNGLFSYSVEIAARTERYWCPIKAARKTGAYHSWYPDYADYGNPEEWKERFNDAKAFDHLKNDGVCTGVKGENDEEVVA